jgi:thioredoxin-dependent peroxiredoxin
MSLQATKFGGRTVNLLDPLPEVGEIAFDFTFVKSDLSEGTLYDFDDKIKVVLGVPSLDTGICQTETRKFNERLGSVDGVVGIVISKDLPFAMKRFCETEGIDNIISASDFRYGDFTTEFGTEMIDGPLKGLSARAIFIIDKENKIRYVQLTPEITVEPDYDAVMDALKALK